MKIYDDLIMQGISEDIQGSRLQKLTQVRDIFEGEVGQWRGKTVQGVLHWLQGIPSAVHIPWEDYVILEWIEAKAKRKSSRGKTDTQNYNLVMRYWQNAAITLHSMLYN